MKSIDFPGAIMKIGEGQDQYHTIHAIPIEGPQGEVIAIYELTDEEVQEIVKTKRIIYSRLTFHNQSECRHCKQVTPTGFQPMLISATPIPFKAILSYKEGNTEQVDAFVGAEGVFIPGYSKTENGQFVKMTEEEIQKQQSEKQEWFVECPVCGCGTNKNTYNFCMGCGTSMNQGQRDK